MSTTDESSRPPRVTDSSQMSAAPHWQRFEPFSGFEESGHTPEQWKTYIRSPAVRLIFNLWHEAEAFAEKIDAFLTAFGSIDIGADAIEAAGLPLPKKVVEYGTEAGHFPDEFAGLLWALRAFGNLTESWCIDPDDWDAEGLAIIRPRPESGRAAG